MYIDYLSNSRTNGMNTGREYLTIEELVAITKREFDSSRLERVRDLYLFACYTFLALIHNQLIMNYLKQATIEIGNDLETTQVHRFA